MPTSPAQFWSAPRSSSPPSRAISPERCAARDLHIAVELNSTEAILGCIESGAGIGFVSRNAVHRQLAAGSLAMVYVKGLSIHRDLLLLTPAGPEPTGPAAAMLAS